MVVAQSKLNYPIVYNTCTCILHVFTICTFSLLAVVLPPEKMADNKSSRLLTLDKDCNKKLNDSETTDDNNKTLNVEVCTQTEHRPNR